MAFPLIARIVGARALTSDNREETVDGVSDVMSKAGSPFTMGLTINDKGLEKRLAQLERTLPAKIDKALAKAAVDGVAIIKNHAEDGRGYKGMFKKYSSSYAQAKFQGWPKTATRSSFSGDQSGVVNLMVTGSMLGSLSSKKGRKKATIYFTRAAEAKKAAFNNRVRPFMGFSRADRRKLRDRFAKELFK